MQKFQFLLLTYWLESPGFLTEVTSDVVRTCFLNTQSHSTLMSLHEHFLCYIPGLTHATPQLHPRQDWPMFSVADFEPSDMRTLGGLPNGLGTLCSGHVPTYSL